jgi:hypothetical protein
LVNNKEVRLQLALAVFVGRKPSPQLQILAVGFGEGLPKAGKLGKVPRRSILESCGEGPDGR